MLIKIRLDNIESEVIKEEKLVLLACIYEGPEYREQVEILKEISEIFNGVLKICIMPEDVIRAIGKGYGIEGSPTFLIFDKGEKKDRLLGRVDNKTLTGFVRRNLPSVKMAIKPGFCSRLRSEA